jgi:hypothetical protein
MEGTEEYRWKMLTEYMNDTDIEQSQVSSELPNHIQLHDEHVQIKSSDATRDATERLHADTTEGQFTASRASDTDQKHIKDYKTGVGTRLHEAGQEESKYEYELQPPSTGEKRRRLRRTQFADLFVGAAPPAHGKCFRTAVDYTPLLDKEDTKVAAKEIRTLPGLRH